MKVLVKAGSRSDPSNFSGPAAAAPTSAAYGRNVSGPRHIALTMIVRAEEALKPAVSLRRARQACFQTFRGQLTLPAIWRSTARLSFADSRCVKRSFGAAIDFA